MRFQRRFAKIKKGSGNSLTIFCDADQWVSNINRGLLQNAKNTGSNTKNIGMQGTGIRAGARASG
jgi:hypothetical protein